MATKRKIRKNYRIDPKLTAWVKKHAKKNKITETQVVEIALKDMKAKEA